MSRYWLVLLVVACLLTGCGRSGSRTVVNADGTWDRNLTLTLTKAVGGPGAGSSTDEFPKTFALPAGIEWQKSETLKDQEKIIKLSRTGIAVGEQITDIVVKPETTTMYKNFVSVKSLGNGRFEYREKIVNPNPKKESAQEDQRFRDQLRKLLPPQLGATEVEMDQVARYTLSSLTRMMFGPDDHLIGVFLGNAEGGERRLKIKMASVLMDSFKITFADRLSSQERFEIAKKMVNQSMNEGMLKQSTKSDPSTNQDTMIGMSTVLVIPGKLIETNGQVDPLNGEIYWDYVNMVADKEPLELRAVWEVTK